MPLFITNGRITQILVANTKRLFLRQKYSKLQKPNAISIILKYVFFLQLETKFSHKREKSSSTCSGDCVRDVIIGVLAGVCVCIVTFAAVKYFLSKYSR